MRAAEQGFLLLTSDFGDANRKVLTDTQLRVLTQRMQAMSPEDAKGEVTVEVLIALGYGKIMAERIVSLLNDTSLLEYYLGKGQRHGCYVLSRISEGFPQILRQRLNLECPGCLWIKGDLTVLQGKKIALVGSRDINPQNKAFAEAVGIQAARQGYTLVSGNARGADKIAQNACLANGGRVISVVADSLIEHKEEENVLFISEGGFNNSFSSQRALHRNRIIHALVDKTFVAQTDFGKGGTWSGTVSNLKNRWSPVFCFDDNYIGTKELIQMGATPISVNDLADIEILQADTLSFLD